MMCFMGGHSGILAAVFVLLVSTAFLVWVAGKTENPLQKFGKGIGWIAFVLTAIFTICSVVCQARTCISGACAGSKGCAMGGWHGMMHMGHGTMPESSEAEKK